MQGYESVYTFMLGVHPVFMLLAGLVLLIPFWVITSKAGYSGFLALLIFIPVANLIYLYFLAFSDWPALRRE